MKQSLSNGLQKIPSTSTKMGRYRKWLQTVNNAFFSTMDSHKHCILSMSAILFQRKRGSTPFFYSMPVKKIMVGGALVILFFLLVEQSNAGEKVYVFYPTTVRAKTIQHNFMNLCPGADVTVFDVYNQFIAKVKSEPPDAILSKPFLFNQLDGFSIVLNGYRNGKNIEPYVLISVDKKMTVTDITDKTKIGALDFFGRKGTILFMKQFFTATPVIMRVTKVEDLLPLLQFKMVAAVVLPQIYADYVKKNSNLNLIIAPFSTVHTGIAAVAIREGREVPKIIESLTAAGKTKTLLYEVEQWKKQH